MTRFELKPPDWLKPAAVSFSGLLGGGCRRGLTEFSEGKPSFLTHPLVGIRFEGREQR
jgi:hypothetical protein